MAKKKKIISPIPTVNPTPTLDEALCGNFPHLLPEHWSQLVTPENLQKKNIYGENMFVLFLRHSDKKNTLTSAQKYMLINLFNSTQSDMFLYNSLNFLTTNPNKYVPIVWEYIEDKSWFVNYIEGNNVGGKYDKLLGNCTIGIFFIKTKLEDMIAPPVEKTSKINKL